MGYPIQLKERRPRDWTAEERISAIMKTGCMNDKERTAWCRKNGIFIHHLDQRKKDAISAVIPKTNKAQLEEHRNLKKEISTLKKDLSRKDKALAETAALLILKKSPGDLGGARGRLISQEDKQTVLKLILEACKSGARKSKAAQLLGLTIRTLQRWGQNGLSDNRKGSRAAPGNKLSYESGDLAADLITDACLREKIPKDGQDK